MAAAWWERDPAAFAAVTLRPIGFVRSPQRVHHDAPRQPRRDADPGPDPSPAVGAAGSAARRGAIHVAHGLQNCLQDLAGFSHLWVLWIANHTRGWNEQVRPPRDDRKRGVFATRAPARPNPLGLSCVRLVAIGKRVLHIGDHDMLDGTPVVDLKPYIPYCDSVPDAVEGYVSGLAADAGDHRDWWGDKGVPPPRVYGERGPADTDDAGIDDTGDGRPG